MRTRNRILIHKVYYLKLKTLDHTILKKHVGNGDERLKVSKKHYLFSRGNQNVYKLWCWQARRDKICNAFLGDGFEQNGCRVHLAGILNTHLKYVIYPMGRKYSAMTSAPHLKLRSNLELKTLFSINDFRLPPCLEGMYGPNVHHSISYSFGRPLEADILYLFVLPACSGLYTKAGPVQTPENLGPLDSWALGGRPAFSLSPGNAPINSTTLQDYAWSPRWDLAEMTENLSFTLCFSLNLVFCPIFKQLTMSHDDSQTNPINISNSIGSTSRIPILYTQDYEVWAHHFEDYLDGSEDNGYLIWEAITLGPFFHSGTNTTVKSQKEYNKLVVGVDNMPQDEKDKLLCNMKAMRMIRFALQSDTFWLVGSCTTAKEIWDRLKEFYSTNEDLEHSIQTLLLSEFGVFEQKPDEKLIQTFDQFNHLLCKMIKHGIERKLIEQKVTFKSGLRPEWIAVVSTVKAHEQFKSYSLAKLMGILKSHESVVTKEAKVVSGVGSLALVSKRKGIAEEEEEVDMSECDLTSEEYVMMVTNPKKFARRKFPVNKNQNRQGSYSSEKVKDEANITSQKDEEKKESKLAGDSGYDCNYCHGKNHFTKDCMLRKMAEKRNGEDDEAYYMRKLEEIKKKKATNISMYALIIQENADEDEFGGVEVWSTDSKDEEVRKPTHGKACVAKEVGSDGKCLIVTASSSTASASEEPNLTKNKCFAAKPVSEQINDCDRLIKKVQSILGSFNVPMTEYEEELNELKLKFSNLSGSLMQTRLTNSNLTDQISRVTMKSEERRMWIELKEQELVRARDETQLHLSCEIGKKIHKMILPFLEFMEDEVIAECESEVSSEETSMSYKIGLDKIETFIDSKEHKCMLKDILDENDRLKIKSDMIHSFDQSNAKLASDNKIDLENTSEFDDESEMSEISVEDVVDCSEFMKSKNENEKPLISENSVEFAQLAKDKEKKLKEKAMVYQKVQTVPNQVYAVTGVTPKQTSELRIMVENDNVEGCDDYF
uniref:Uncharacterized protein n=1 Tax=Lactuca sativa TaxID=4236 RepID=A0A9R1ULB4_LACSA|nr:hypothetical protein LSAT_V11C800435370 [Lactuca sativa]